MEVNDNNKKQSSVDGTLKEAKVVYKTISGGLVASLTKNVLQHGLFWIIVYILGLYNFSWKVSNEKLTWVLFTFLLLIHRKTHISFL